VMVLVTLSDKYHVDNIKLQIDEPDLDFSKAKDRVRRSFNPDFFIKIDLDEYI